MTSHGERGFQMETFLSAVIGELASRSLSFLIDKYCKPPALSMEESLWRLQLMLLRVRVAVEEAEGRHLTSHAMLQQLNVLREEMYSGYYVLDKFRRQAHKGDEVSYSSLSKFNPSKRVRLYTGCRHGKDELEDMLQSVEMTVTGMDEFVIFLKNYSPMCRQPYSMYMFMEKCMFGRQMEMERVINILLDREPLGTDNFSVLPIIGAAKVGKSTLIEHICFDERVRNHFSCIIFFSENDFSEEKPCTLRDGGVVKHQRTSSSDEERLLIVIDLAGEVEEDVWRKLYSASRSRFPPDSKIIITSRSDTIAKFGTTQPLHLRFLSREAYWYFFRALAFGSSDPQDQPKLASMAVEIFDEYFDHDEYDVWSAGHFIHANTVAYSLRASHDARYWRRVLECVRENRDPKDQLLLCRCSSDFGVKRIPVLIPRISGSSIYCELHGPGRVGLAHEEAPKIAMKEITFGSVTPQPHERFEMVIWKSHLPPYHSYIQSCEIHESKCVVTGNKHRQKRKASRVSLLE